MWTLHIRMERWEQARDLHFMLTASFTSFVVSWTWLVQCCCFCGRLCPYMMSYLPSSHHLLLLLLIIILFLYAAVLLASRWPCIGLPLPLLLLWGLSRRLAVSVALHNL